MNCLDARIPPSQPPHLIPIPSGRPTPAELLRGRSVEQFISGPKLSSARRESLAILTRPGKKCIADLPNELILEIFKALSRIDPTRWNEIRKLVKYTPKEHHKRFEELAAIFVRDKNNEFHAFMGGVYRFVQCPPIQDMLNDGAVHPLQLAQEQFSGVHPSMLTEVLRSLRGMSLVRTFEMQKALKQGELGNVPDEFRTLGSLVIVHKLAATAQRISVLVKTFPGLKQIWELLQLYRVSSFLHLNDRDAAISITQREPKGFPIERYLPQLAKMKLIYEGIGAFEKFLTRQLNCSGDKLYKTHPTYFREAYQVLRQEGNVDNCIAILDKLDPLPGNDYRRGAQCAAMVVRKNSISADDFDTLIYLIKRAGDELMPTKMFYCACFVADSPARCQALQLDDLRVPVEFKRIIASIERYTTDGEHNYGIDRRLCLHGKILASFYSLQKCLSLVRPFSDMQAPSSPKFVQALKELKRCEAAADLFKQAIKDLVLVDLETAAAVAPYLNDDHQLHFIECVIEALNALYGIRGTFSINDLFAQIPSRHSKGDLKEIATFVTNISPAMRREVCKLGGWHLLNIWLVGGMITLDIDMAIARATTENIPNENDNEAVITAILERLKKLAAATNEVTYLDKAQGIVGRLSGKSRIIQLFELGRVSIRQGWFEKSQEILRELNGLGLLSRNVDLFRQCLGSMMCIHGRVIESHEMLMQIADLEQRIMMLRAAGALTTAFWGYDKNDIFFQAIPWSQEDVAIARVVDGFNVAIATKDLLLAERLLPDVPATEIQTARQALSLCRLEILLDERKFQQAEALVMQIEDRERRAHAILKIATALRQAAKQSSREKRIDVAENQRSAVLRLVDSIEAEFLYPMQPTWERLLQDLISDYDAERNGEAVRRVKNYIQSIKDDVGRISDV